VDEKGREGKGREKKAKDKNRSRVKRNKHRKTRLLTRYKAIHTQLLRLLGQLHITL